MDTFIQNMNNKTVQERPGIEPKEMPEEALRFAAPLQEGSSQQRSFGGEAGAIKTEPIWPKNEPPKNPWTRCGLELIQNHMSLCKAKDERCRNCGGFGYFARMCEGPKTFNFERLGRKAITGRMRRVNLIDKQTNQSEGSTKKDAGNVALRINGDGAPPFVLKRKKRPTSLHKDWFGLPNYNFYPIIFEKTFPIRCVFCQTSTGRWGIRRLQRRPVNLLGCTTKDANEGKQTLKKAQIVIARDEKKSFIGRNWLANLQGSRVKQK